MMRARQAARARIDVWRRDAVMMAFFHQSVTYLMMAACIFCWLAACLRFVQTLWNSDPYALFGCMYYTAAAVHLHVQLLLRLYPLAVNAWHEYAKWYGKLCALWVAPVFAMWCLSAFLSPRVMPGAPSDWLNFSTWEAFFWVAYWIDTHRRFWADMDKLNHRSWRHPLYQPWRSFLKIVIPMNVLLTVAGVLVTSKLAARRGQVSFSKARLPIIDGCFGSLGLAEMRAVATAKEYYFYTKKTCEDPTSLIIPEEFRVCTSLVMDVCKVPVDKIFLPSGLLSRTVADCLRRLQLDDTATVAAGGGWLTYLVAHSRIFSWGMETLYYYGRVRGIQMGG